MGDGQIHELSAGYYCARAYCDIYVMQVRNVCRLCLLRVVARSDSPEKLVTSKSRWIIHSVCRFRFQRKYER